MMLSNIDIVRHIDQGLITISPLEQTLIRPASINLRLGTSFLLPETDVTVDLKSRETFPKYYELDANIFTLEPKKLVLANTHERIGLCRNVAGWLSNVSGLARLGLNVVGSNLVSPGFGEDEPTTLTLELYNFLDKPIKIYSGMRICHLVLFEVLTKSSIGYDELVGTYSHQSEARSSQYFQEMQEESDDE